MFAINVDQTNIMIVFGGSGSGKRTFCQLLANDLNITLHDTDVTADVSTFGFGMHSDENRSLHYNLDRDFISGHIFGNSYDNEISTKGSFGNILYSTYTTRSVRIPFRSEALNLNLSYFFLSLFLSFSSTDAC